MTDGGPDFPYRLPVLRLKLLFDTEPAEDEGLLCWGTNVRPVGGFGAKYPLVPGRGILLGRRLGVSGPKRESRSV